MRKVGFLVFMCRLLSSGVFAQSTYPGCDTPDITIGDHTISACNVGSNIAGTGTESYGSYFQWGNNYPFSDTIVFTSDIQVDVSTCGPIEYYSSNIFIIASTAPYDRASPQNNNLWGGTGSEIERQGPCATGYHIPSGEEIQYITTTAYDLGIFTGIKHITITGRYDVDIEERDKFLTHLKIPASGFIARQGFLTATGTNAYFWASDAIDDTRSYSLYSISTLISGYHPFSRSYGFPVRCFKNTTPPTQTGTCTNLPTNAEWNTTGSILQTRDYATSNFLPTLIGSYNTTSSTTECLFKCSTGYQRNGTNCTLPRSSSGGGGGGSVNLKQDNCPNGDLSPSYYDGECGDKKEESIKGEESKSDESDETPLLGGEGGVITTASPAQTAGEEGVDNEILSAYDRAFKHNITTLAPIDNANPDGTVIRGHLAKMVVNYATNVLGRTLPDKIPVTCYRKDGNNARESSEIKDYAIKSCQLGLMGIDMDYFQPNATVTRAQFGTILSRLLRQNTYAGGSPYYTKHLQALKENGIMSQIDNPEGRLELRQWVWLMLMRSKV